MRITVLGSGVVGQATGCGLIQKGHEVTFLDVNAELVRELCQQGIRAYDVRESIPDIQSDVIMVCIGTPPHPVTRAVDLSYITAGMKTVAGLIQNQGTWPVVVIRSTVPPTTTRDILIPLIEENSGLKAGRDFGVCMNPEFLRAKSSAEDFANPWATVIGEHDVQSGAVIADLYRPFGGEMYRTSLTEAEFIKYKNNLRNAVIISFTNEMWLLGQKLNIDANRASQIVSKTAESAWNSAYGSTGGYPYGGTCLPKDTLAFLEFSKENDHDLPLLAAAVHVNDKMEDLANKNIIPPAQIEGFNWQPSPAKLDGGLL
ncbi:MAG: nucleotide sugar dehydrogenase [Ardenticatenaceae bacterium]|nr:nucleotide sugar dehydrogenase [Ardenticatenaceae bacterium]